MEKTHQQVPSQLGYRAVKSDPLTVTQADL